jgi:hypothetical protein
MRKIKKPKCSRKVEGTKTLSGWHLCRDEAMLADKRAGIELKWF